MFFHIFTYLKNTSQARESQDRNTNYMFHIKNRRHNPKFHRIKPSILYLQKSCYLFIVKFKSTILSPKSETVKLYCPFSVSVVPEAKVLPFKLAYMIPDMLS